MFSLGADIVTLSDNLLKVLNNKVITPIIVCNYESHPIKTFTTASMLVISLLLLIVWPFFYECFVSFGEMKRQIEIARHFVNWEYLVLRCLNT